MPDTLPGPSPPSRPPEPSPRRSFASGSLWQLTRSRILGFLREPEAVFWTFAFPILMALALGIAFRNSGAQRWSVGVEEGPGASATHAALERSPVLEGLRLAPGEADVALRRGRIQVLVRGGGHTPRLVYDPTRPESQLASRLVEDALERAAGREDRLAVARDTRVRPGSRYVDFLLPGLIGLNLLGTGMWGVGFPIATARQQKLLKRMIATPMRRSEYLWSLMLARAVWLALEVAVVLGFGMLAFGIEVRGSWAGFALVNVAGAFAFSALGLLVVSRARTVEAVSGLMNFVMMPMWLLSGSFFSSERFPDVMQPLVRALPLTIVNDALRAIMNEGAGLLAVGWPLAALLLWGWGSFAVAVWVFRWE